MFFMLSISLQSLVILMVVMCVCAFFFRKFDFHLFTSVADCQLVSFPFIRLLCFSFQVCLLLSQRVAILPFYVSSHCVFLNICLITLVKSNKQLEPLTMLIGLLLFDRETIPIFFFVCCVF